MSLSSSLSSGLRLKGLVAATFTPFAKDGSVDYGAIAPMIDFIIANGVNGVYALGSTGEGVSMTTAERYAVAEATVAAVGGRVPVVIQVGHNSIEEMCGFAEHAQRIGADAISATPPTYFKPATLESLIDCVARVAGSAPQLPFYYYNLPSFTGVRFDMVRFLEQGGPRIPTLHGIKFSDAMLHELQACSLVQGGRYDILFGIDEMLLGGLCFGAVGAVGSTYNFAAPLYRRVIAAFERGDLEEARLWQARAVQVVEVVVGNGGRGGLKAAMALVGCDCGISRLPTLNCTATQREKMRTELAALGFFEWIAS